MTTETIEIPATPADPEPQTVETEEPTTEPVAEPAAPEPEAAAAPQVEVVEAEKPDYMTRADWEREKAEVASRAAADALESDRRKRQTENARRAKAEQDARESEQEAVDTLRAALGAKGIFEVPDDAALAAINRIASKKAERLSKASLDTLDDAWDYITAPAYGKKVDLADEAEPAASRLVPKVQHLIDAIRPAIETKAREGYIAEAELPKYVEAEIAKRAANGRKGQEEVPHVEGTPTPSVMSWAAYMNLPEETRLAMPAAERQAIMVADRKARGL